MKVIFWGTPSFAIPVMEALIRAGYDVSAVFSGNGPVAQAAVDRGIKLFQPRSLRKNQGIFKEFENLKPDICIVAAYGKIIPKEFLDVPRYGFLNVHPSILPEYRGPSPVQTAIFNGDKETGASIMVVDKEVDHGPILAKAPYKIPDSKYNTEIAENIFKLGAQLLIKILPGYINGDIKPIEQDHDRATFTKIFSRQDGRINWNESADKIYDHIRALNPEPGTWTVWHGKVLNIIRAAASDIANAEKPGTVVKLDKNIAVATKKCYLIINSIQLEGGKVMDAKEFVNGHPGFIGSVLE